MYNAYCKENKGDKLKTLTNLEVKNLLTLAFSMLDPATLSRIQQLFYSLTHEEFVYLDSITEISSTHNLLAEIRNITLSINPKDRYLQQLVNEYKLNLTNIDELRNKRNRLVDENLIQDFNNRINSYKERNLDIIEKINDYKNKKIALIHY
jgi:hypothetical protein